MLRTAIAFVALIVALLFTASGPAASQQTCSQSTVRSIVDETGRVLRQLHQDAKPRLDAGFLELKKRRGWSDAEHQEKSAEFLTDDKMEALDAKAGELLARLDRMADKASDTETDCVRLGEIEATALELQAAVRSKLRHMLARLDAAVGAAPMAAAPAPTTPSPPPPPALPPAASKPPAGPVPPATSLPPARPAPSDKQAAATPIAPPPSNPPTSSWQTQTSEERVAIPPPPPARANPPPPPGARPPPVPDTDGFSIDEIREASRGLFGTLSSELAGVIEYAFANSGRPTGYILGNEGGGAFIAGVRYGRGTLFTRGGQSREVYWHGPSIGYDFGASGSKTLFLVYGLGDPLEIFSGFSGVDGSAYLVGGVGMTLLTDGRLFLAPIRTGLGLRIGASIGYVRFTPRSTWNPF